MSLGVPVVATAVGSVSEVIGLDYPTVLAPPGNDEKLSESLLSVVANQTLRERLATLGRARVESHFSFARRMAKVAGVYDDLLAR